MAAEAKLVITAEANTAKARKELNALKSAGITAADEVAKANRRAARHPLRLLAPWAIVIGGIMKGARLLVKTFGELVQRGRQLREAAKNLGLSVETYSALEAHAKRAGATTEQFNNALARLKDGRATLDEISEGFNKIGDSAKAAGDVAKDVLARQMTRWADGFKNAMAATAQWLTRNVFTITKESKLGNLGYPAIEAAIERGLDRAEAIKIASNEMGGYVGDGRVKELGQYYDARIRAREGEQMASEMRVAARYMKDLGDAEKARQAWQEHTRKEITPERFAIYTEKGKTEGDKYADILAKYKATSADGKAGEKKEKQWGLEQGFTYGGGALAGLTYAFMGDCAGSYAYEQIKVLKAIAKTEEGGAAKLAEISQTLKGD